MLTDDVLIGQRLYHLLCFIFKTLNREEGKSFLCLPVVPHIGETDSDTLTEIPDRLALHHGPDEEEEDEYGYSWSESPIRYNTQRPAERAITLTHAQLDTERKKYTVGYFMFLQTKTYPKGGFVRCI